MQIEDEIACKIYTVRKSYGKKIQIQTCKLRRNVLSTELTNDF